MLPPPPTVPVVRSPWRQVREFAALEGDATFLWPRWIVLRAVGIVYILIFAGIIASGRALVGPEGIAPLPEFFAHQIRTYPSAVEAFLRAPGLFWISAGGGMLAALSWAGLAAAVAVTLNLWPRLALFGCWLIFLSFITTGRFFAATQPDQLMIEAALLCIPFAPAGLRPGLGANSPPRPIALFMARWLLLRIMFEAGVMKLVAGEQWRNLTAMDVMYETTPFPTILGYLDHQLPHAYHVFEIGLTFAAELAAPLLAVFSGRRGRWIAFALWAAFQAGIELTNNFGWLNGAAIALGVLLLDDQMLAAAASRCKWRRPAALLAARTPPPPVPAIGPWGLWSLRGALGLQFVLTLFFFGVAWTTPTNALARTVFGPVEYLFGDFHSSNAYPLFEGLPPIRYGLEFEGSNDGGETWRTYPFRYQPQRVDRICPFIAPWYARFEATLEITLNAVPNSPIFAAVATHLLQHDPKVIGLFVRDPFPDRPPMMVRMPVYLLNFTDFATYRKTGRFWRKEYEGDYAPMLYTDDDGKVVSAK